MDIFGIDKSKRIEVITAGPRNVIIEYFGGNNLFRSLPTNLHHLFKMNDSLCVVNYHW